MASKEHQLLLTLTALALIISLPACAGDVTSSPETQTSPPTYPEKTPTPTQERVQDTPEPAAQGWGDVVVWEASDAHANNGLQMGTGGDVDTEPVVAGNPPEQARLFGSGEAIPSDDGNNIIDYYMRFSIDDAFVYKGSPTSRVRIEIEYLDEGTDRFFIEYDAESGGPQGNGRFKPTEYVVKTDSGEFKTAVFWVNDAYFGNRIQRADFRIDGASDGAEIIRRVTITRIMPGSDLASQISMDFYHDGNHLTTGQCTTLHWVVQSATDVTLDGNPVDHQGFDYECPQSTTTYVLLAWNANGQVRDEITITVSPRSPTGSATFDLRASCNLAFGGTGFQFFVTNIQVQYPGQQSDPVTFDAYVGDPGSMGLVGSVDVPPLYLNFASSWSYMTDKPCCEIIIRDNDDLNPANDSYSRCY